MSVPILAQSVSEPLKWHGGKHYLARRIVELMPSHLHYVEPYAGGLAVLLVKDPTGVSEVVNDLDGRLMGFWRVLQDPEQFERFPRARRSRELVGHTLPALTSRGGAACALLNDAELEQGLFYGVRGIGARHFFQQRYCALGIPARGV